MGKRKLSSSASSPRKHQKCSISLVDLEEHILERIVLYFGANEAKAWVLSCQRFLGIYRNKTRDRSTIDWALWTFRVKNNFDGKRVRYRRIEAIDNFVTKGRLLVDEAIRVTNYACKHACVDLLDRFLKDNRISTFFWSEPVLLIACKYGHPSIVQKLLRDPRVDPIVNYYEAIKIALEESHFEILRLLLEHPSVRDSLPEYLSHHVRKALDK